MSSSKVKTCFVIAPIGDENSDTRKRSDNIFEFIIEPVARSCGYASIDRADKIESPGMITSQIIAKIVDATLVVADLTGYNPNVFYELAIRHMVKQPIVQMIHTGQLIPFDVRPIRTITFDYTDLRSVEACKKELAEKIIAVEKNPADCDNPISSAMDLKSLRAGGDVVQKVLVTFITTNQELMQEIVGAQTEFAKTLVAFSQRINQIDDYSRQGRVSSLSELARAFASKSPLQQLADMSEKSKQELEELPETHVKGSIKPDNA